MIDVHMHVGRLYFGEAPLTPDFLLKFMDRNEIETAALLPIENPEEVHYLNTTDRVLEVCRQHPDRFFPFCNVDPRIRSVEKTIQPMLEEYQAQGCKGVGEVIPGLHVDYPGLQCIYEACGRLGLPVLLHMDGLKCKDERGLPRLEQMLKQFSETVFIGHAQHFWSEISPDATDETLYAYPTGEIKEDGPTVRLLSTYDNLHADLSGGSGFNALTRDPEFGWRFLEKFQDKLMFGTDIAHLRDELLDEDDRFDPADPLRDYNERLPLASYLKTLRKEGRISQTVFQKIAEDNAKQMLGL